MASPGVAGMAARYRFLAITHRYAGPSAADAGLRVVGEAADGAEAVALASQLDPDLVLMDIRMPGVDGIEATRRLIRSGTRSRVLMLTTFDLDEHPAAIPGTGM